jgi:hypothetical protein
VFFAKGMYVPADLLERIRLLLVRKRGPKRHARPPLVSSPAAPHSPSSSYRTASA